MGSLSIIFIFNYEQKNRGYTKNFIALNDVPKTKSNNLAYLINIFMSPTDKKILSCTSQDEKYYSLSLLVHWIINVADIEKPVCLYLPSNRQRNLLLKWLNNEI